MGGIVIGHIMYPEINPNDNEAQIHIKVNEAGIVALYTPIVCYPIAVPKQNEQGQVIGIDERPITDESGEFIFDRDNVPVKAEMTLKISCVADTKFSTDGIITFNANDISSVMNTPSKLGKAYKKEATSYRKLGNIFNDVEIELRRGDDDVDKKHR